MWLMLNAGEAWSPSVLACYSGDLADVRVLQSRAGRLFAYFDVIGPGGRTPFIAWPAMVEQIDLAYLTDEAPATVLAVPEPGKPCSVLHLAPHLSAYIDPPLRRRPPREETE